MNFSVNVNAIADYVNEVGSDSIILALAGSAPTIGYLTTQLNVNEKTAIHLMDVTGSFVDQSCEVTDGTEFTFTDRYLEPAFVKQESIICTTDFIGKYMNWNAKNTASNNDIPFGQVMVEEFAKSVGKNLEDFIWNGYDSTDGLKAIITDEGTKVKVGTTNTTYGMIEDLILALPSEQVNDTEIFVSHATLMELKRDLLKNDFRLIDLEFTNGTEVDKNTIKMPVYNIPVHAVDGLKGDGNAYAIVPAHTVYGTSVEGAHTDVKAIYDEVNDRHILRAKLVAAVQVAYPAETFYTAKED